MNIWDRSETTNEIQSYANSRERPCAFLRRMVRTRRAGLFVRHDRAGYPPASVDFRRLGLPGADAPIDFAWEHCRSMEHCAECESGNCCDAEPDCHWPIDGNRTDNSAVAGGMDQRERHDCGSRNTQSVDAYCGAKCLWLGWREFHLLRSGGHGLYTRCAGIYACSHNRSPWSSSRQQRCGNAVGANSRRGHLFQS